MAEDADRVQARDKLVALAANIEGVGDDYSDMMVEIRRLESAVQPGAKVADIQRGLKATSSRLEQKQKHIRHVQQQFLRGIDDILPAESWPSQLQPTGAPVHQALLGMIWRHFGMQGEADVARQMLTEDGSLPHFDLKASSTLQRLLRYFNGAPSSGAGFKALELWASRHSLELNSLESKLPNYLASLKVYHALLAQDLELAINVLREDQHVLSPSDIELLAGAISMYGTASWEPMARYFSEIHQSAKLAVVRDFWAMHPDDREEDLLIDTLEASVLAFPALDKISKAVAMTPWNSENKLPVEIELPSHLQFHPIFVCPVLKEETEDSEHKLPPCGHLISSEAYQSLLQPPQTHMKCAYCPKTFSKSEVRDVKLIR